MKTELFQFCGHCRVFPICWHSDCSTFTALSFRIWNSSTGVPTPPLALFVVMLPKAHLASHYRISGSRRVITPFWLSGSCRSFLDSSSVYSCHLFIKSASVRSIPFLSFIVPIFAWNFPGGSDSKSVCLQCKRPGFDPWVWKIPWRRKWQPTPVLLPGKSQGRGSLVGCRLWGRTESDTTEAT